MEKIAVITDTASDLSPELIGDLDIRILPFRIVYPDREYIDGVDITSDKIYADMKDTVIRSSIPSLEDTTNLFDRLRTEGFTHVLAVTLSEGLSGIAGSIRLIAKNFPELTTHVEDSRSISLGEGVLALEAARMVRENLPFDRIVSEISALKSRVKLYFVVETLEYLIRGGRIGRIGGTLAEMLNVKPVISSSLEDGKYFTIAKVRGRRKSIGKLLELAAEYVREKKARAYILHGNAMAEMEAFAQEVRKLENISQVILGGNITPVAGVHSGPGLIGIVLVTE